MTRKWLTLQSWGLASADAPPGKTRATHRLGTVGTLVQSFSSPERGTWPEAARHAPGLAASLQICFSCNSATARGVEVHFVLLPRSRGEHAPVSVEHETISAAQRCPHLNLMSADADADASASNQLPMSVPALCKRRLLAGNYWKLSLQERCACSAGYKGLGALHPFLAAACRYWAAR